MSEESGTFFFFFFFFCPLGPHPRHLEVPRLGVEKGLQLPAHPHPSPHNKGSKLLMRPTPQLTTTPDLNPLSEAKD